ncbi:DNA polymerase [Sphingobium cloacae]|uniref:DNA polymerase n=1 Tax=Sphingobium cloacae TaxID=120107 RepID=A0A1E1EYN0_9SPHN|nr:DNA polymerase [Sphingobium cloacae]
MIQWVYETYGRRRAALCSTVIRYRAKGALRDVGKAMELPEDVIELLSSQIWGWSMDGTEANHAEELNPNMADRRLRLTLDIARRKGRETVDYLTPELERVLGKTLGVPLFQEQAMQVVMVCAGFFASEADQLRRAMATFKHTGGVVNFRERRLTGMVERGYSEGFAERSVNQLEGFGSYGFR